jgi:hypothetical protein
MSIKVFATYDKVTNSLLLREPLEGFANGEQVLITIERVETPGEPHERDRAND